MYKRLKQSGFFKAFSPAFKNWRQKPVTKHGTGKIERRARVALLIGIGIGLTAAVCVLLYIARLAPVLKDLLPTLVKATIIPLIIVTFYLVGVLDADEDIYKEKEADDDTDG